MNKQRRGVSFCTICIAKIHKIIGETNHGETKYRREHHKEAKRKQQSLPPGSTCRIAPVEDKKQKREEMSEKDFEIIVSRFRNARALARIAPFVCDILYGIPILLYGFCSEAMASALDFVFYVGPVTVLLNLAFSRVFRLCNWHKIACVLPLPVQTVSLVDLLVYDFSAAMDRAMNACCIVLGLLYLIAAYKVFFCKQQTEQ